MKKKKNGFTLAEVLITITIIGVIATMVLPTLQRNVMKQQAGPAFAKAVNTLESANRLLLTQNNARNLAQACGAEATTFLGTNYLNCLMNNDILRLSRNETQRFISAFNDPSGGPSSMYCRDGNDGLIYCPDSDNEEISNSGANLYDGRHFQLYIDINGNKGPDSLGEDVFLVLVDLRGYIIPFGGSLYQEYVNAESILWQTQCIRGTITDGMACAGAVADNNWQVRY